jgi:carbamoyl-phosphate synthase large subunit
MRPFKRTVAITGLNATDNPGPGVAVARALRSDPAFQGRIVGLAYDVLDPGLYAEGLLDAAFLLPWPSMGTPAFLDRLAYVQRSVGIDVLIPTLDSEIEILVGQEDALWDLGIATLLPTQDSLKRSTKTHLPDLAEHGIPVPAGRALSRAPDLLVSAEELGWPLVLKSRLYGAEICHTMAHASRAFHGFAAKWGLPVIAQQHLVGEELNICALGNRGDMVGAVAMKKLLITDQGKGWAGVAIQDERLMSLAARVIRHLAWHGPCELELIRGHDGQLNLLEINPRFPAWADLCGHAGQNLCLAAVQMAHGDPVASFTSYRAGAAFVRISVNQLVDISDLEGLMVDGQTNLERRTA